MTVRKINGDSSQSFQRGQWIQFTMLIYAAVNGTAENKNSSKGNWESVNNDRVKCIIK